MLSPMSPSRESPNMGVVLGIQEKFGYDNFDWKATVNSPNSLLSQIVIQL